MKQYKIPITWESIKIYEVEAENLQDAVRQALKTFLAEPDEDYLNDSFDVDSILEDDYPDEEYDLHEAVNNLKY